MGSREAPYERDSVEGPLGSGTAESREPSPIWPDPVVLKDVLVREADPQTTVTKTEVRKEILEHATPSEEAVSLLFGPL